MKPVIIDFITKLQSVTSVEDLDRLFTNMMRQLGFNRYAYQLSKAIGHDPTKPVIVASYPKEWVDYYLSSKYHLIDPIVTQSPKEKSPFQWSQVLKTLDLNKRQKQFFNEADDYGVANGLGIPIHGVCNSFSVVSLVADTNDKELSKLLVKDWDTIHIMSLYYHQAIKDLLRKQSLVANDNATLADLTEREKECLRWSAQGKTSWEISKILSISERTVIFHIENAKTKLGVCNRNHAVVKAIMLNII
jgi:LuxR family transcriptional activator of conjugal transfer of Ti plasmids